MIETCPADGELVAIELGRVATQYREAERLTGYMRAVLGQVERASQAACSVPSFFDLPTAVGEQLTFIGERMGFPRCHCVCESIPVFGFACDGVASTFPIVGFCEDGTWKGCEGVSDLCINDDEVYRQHLFARRYQMLGLFDGESLTSAIRHLWGAAAFVIESGRGRVVLAPGRTLTPDETVRLAVSLRALPVAPGIRLAMYFGDPAPFGFGAGWGGICDGDWFCPLDVDTACIAF